MKNEKLDTFAWLQALIDVDDFSAAELFVSKMQPDFERVYSRLMLAKAYHDHGKQEESYTCASHAVTLWQVCSEEWWFFPMLGDLLRKVVDCDQTELAEKVIAKSSLMVEGVGHNWIETHGWCGLAQGAACLGQQGKAYEYFKRAILVAESRSTAEERASAMSVVETTMKIIEKELPSFWLTDNV